MGNIESLRKQILHSQLKKTCEFVLDTCSDRDWVSSYWLKNRKCTYSIDSSETYFHNTPWDFLQTFRVDITEL